MLRGLLTNRILYLRKFKMTLNLLTRPKINLFINNIKRVNKILTNYLKLKSGIYLSRFN